MDAASKGGEGKDWEVDIFDLAESAFVKYRWAPVAGPRSIATPATIAGQ